jgi:hypothetical protein
VSRPDATPKVPGTFVEVSATPNRKVPTTFRSDRFFVAACSLAAAALSFAYIAFYLRGGPRIIDATSYYLEARAFAQGHLSFHLDEPVASTLGRFLVRTDVPDGTRAAVIFPPGYPALLALGFLVGQPLVIGPLLAAAITFSTWHLARAVVPDEPSSFVSVPRLATLFSVACAALRYHTADTMSHGLSALCFSSALVFALGVQRAAHAARSVVIPSIGLGFFTGWLVATRPVSALALVATLAFVLAPLLRTHAPAFLRCLGPAAAASLPGVALLLAHQYAATGHLFASSQTAYYAVSDGPPGCFRYGLGSDIGCVGEHGEFVQHNLAHGYGAYAATATTLRRLKQHLVDAGNAEPLFFVVLAGAVFAWRDPRRRWISLGVLAQILAYVPFYFDGNYPGGGARFYADVLPLEHLLLALAVVHFAQKAADDRAKLRRALALLALAPLGFLARGQFQHAALRDREGGRPMFEMSNLPAARGPALLFIDTDHGFNLAFDPDTQNHLTSNQWSVVRRRGDALDLFAWQAHGKPPTYAYEYPLGTKESSARVVPYPLDPSAPLVIEAENLWPPRAQSAAYTLAPWPDARCASARRWLAVTPVRPDQPGSITLGLPTPYLVHQRITPRLGFQGAGAATISWVIDGDVKQTSRVTSRDEGEGTELGRCVRGPYFEVPEGAKNLSVVVVRDAAPREIVVAMDRFDIERMEKR